MQYLDDIYLIGLNLEQPTGFIPEVPDHNELPWRPPSPTSTEKMESDCESHYDVKDEEVALLFQDWSVRLTINIIYYITIVFIMFITTK